MPHKLKLPLKLQENSPAENIRIHQDDLDKSLRMLEIDLQKGRDKINDDTLLK